MKASHIVGGEIYYDYLGNNTYTFYISVYRDCLSNGAGFDSPLSLGVFNENNQLINNIQVPYTGSTQVPVSFNNPCVTPPNNICTENSVYTVTLTLPPSNGGYTLAYQRCCRGPNINNIVNPDDTGLTLSCHIPGVANNNFENSSPRFNNYPPLLLCNNDDLVFDHSATDPDGDQLVYSLVTPNSGANSIQPAPNPPPPPPYSNVIWNGGNSAASPLGPGSSISINPTTGLLTASPNLTGIYVVGIRVQELRNGVVINEVVRDFLFKVFNCNLQVEAILPAQDQLTTFVGYCDGLTVHFENNSYSQITPSYHWDFGVPGITTDQSSTFEPTYTYPAPGQYFATLVVNPGLPCTDTAIIEIIVAPPYEVSYQTQDSLCFEGNSFDFVANTDGPTGTEITWNFGPTGSQLGATGTNVNNINFSSTGFIPVTVYAEYFQCESSFVDSIYIFPDPIAEMIYPDTVECKGLTIDFLNNSQNGTSYLWDFGVNGTNTDVSSSEDPTFTFPSPGTYEVELITFSSPQCSDTVKETIVINHKLEVDFTAQDSMCITNNSFDFIGNVSGPADATYTWNFGPHGSLSNSTNLIENNVTFDTTGSISISLIGEFNICKETATQNIYLYQEPQIDFILEPGLQCVPFNAQFTDLSYAETGIDYLWDFGDGTTSTEQNPSHLYTQTGNYPITLTIMTSSGCIDTLVKIEPDIINVQPNPVASFTVTPERTDICHSTIAFNNFSQNAESYRYLFDDGTISHEANPFHTYLEHGTHNPQLIVTSPFGCKDTTFRTIFIEPYTLYAPNTFTPDGDEFNNNFKIITALGVENWNLKIYNRWGELIYESNDPELGWDGTNQAGRVAQNGLYIWKLRYKTCEPTNSDKLLTGHVSLFR